MVAVVAGASAFVTAPVSAGPADTVALVGSGTISPGLTPVCCVPQTFTFNGTGGGTVNGVTGVFNCAAEGDDHEGTYSNGDGGFSGNCSAPCGTVVISGLYTRLGSVVSMTGAITAGCVSGRNFSGRCNFTPTSGPVVTSYHLSCEIAVS
jgi:hypothetical protein